MQKFIFSVLLFLSLILLTIFPCSGITETHVWENDVSNENDYQIGGGTDGYSSRFNTIYTNDISEIEGLYFASISIEVSKLYPGAFPLESDYSNVQFKIGSDVIGTGIAGYTRGADRIYIHYWVQSDGGLLTEGYSGTKDITIANSVFTGDDKVSYSIQSGAPPYPFISYSKSGAIYYYTGGNAIIHYYTYRYFYNKIVIIDDSTITEVNITRISGNSSKFKITDPFELINETSLQYDDILTASINSSINIYGINYAGDVFDYTYSRVARGSVEFNQSYYTDPEDIQVSWDVDSFDSGAYTYEIQVITSVSGEFSQDSWPADGKWNVSPFISSASGAAVFDFYSDGYDLPIWIQGELWAQDKSSGAWTKLDSTSAVIYHEAALESGKISTDKGSYNVSEIVTVTYTSYAGNIKIRAYQHGSITTYWYNDLPSGTDQTIKISFDEKDRGPWDLRLIENDVFTNYTSIEITSGDTPYVKWYRSVYDQGQIAPYRIGGSGGLMLYSTDVNTTLSIFDAANTEIYNFSVGSGNNNMQINFAESAAPGMWTASLLNLGVRYNDTTMVTSTSSLISFNSSVYVTGDTIGINYFIPSSDYRIMLLDANFKEIIIFTTQNGVLSTGTYQTIPFSLVDNNEYGFNMIAAIDAGSYATGYWEVWVVDQYGTFLDNGTVWDRAKVSKSSGDSADTSNEMISIFFSPEGAFMLFTVCLTMMGLVLAKHPAGGGAGATVGVGFGTYFNVLPVWMLMLTVILLVVMAGVSIAVYYKGK